MISLTCTSCKQVLEIDDAFAGGVCRCQHCGTIQTVPSSLKPSARAGAPASGQPTVTAARTLYQRPQRGGSQASAGAAPDAPTPATAPARAAAPQAAADRTPSTLLMRAAVAAVVLLAAVIVIILWLTLR